VPEETELATAGLDGVAGEAPGGEDVPEVKARKAAFRMPRLTGKLRIIVAAAAVLVLGAGAALWFTGVLTHPGKSVDASVKSRDAVTPPAPVYPAPVYVEIPDIVANMSGGSHKQTSLKLTARLELARAADTDKVREAMPRIQDLFQAYLREMRPEDLRGPGGTYRLREELLGRANVAAAPSRIIDILFTQMIMQ